MQPSVLLVDDDLVSLTLAEGILRREFGDSITIFSTKTVTDGQRIMLTHGIDCLVLDLSLPGFTGGEVVSHFRELFREIPIIVLTGASAQNMELQVVARGAVSFCNKMDCATHLPRLVVEAYRLRLSQDGTSQDLYRRLDSLVTVLEQVSGRLQSTDNDFRAFHRQVVKSVVGMVTAVAVALLGVIMHKLFGG